MCSFPSAPERSFASSCKTIRYSTVPCNLGLLRVRREQVALHLERDSSREQAHQPKVQFLRRTFGLQGSIGTAVASIHRAAESGYVLGNWGLKGQAYHSFTNAAARRVRPTRRL